VSHIGEEKMSKKEERQEEKMAKPARVVAGPARKAIIGKRRRRAAMPMKEGPKETRPSTVRSSTVRGKMAEIQNERGEIEKGIAVLYEGVGALYDSIKAQAIENTEAASAIFSGAQDIQVGIRALQSSINEKIKENADYVKNFYG
jgi:hypothetical protein